MSSKLKPVRVERTSDKKLKKKKKKRRRLPLPEPFYHTLLVGIIGYRQNLFCWLEEFVGQLARGNDCRHLIGVYRERMLQQCSLEYFVAGLAYRFYPNFKPPHGLLNYPELKCTLPQGLDNPVERVSVTRPTTKVTVHEDHRKRL